MAYSDAYQSNYNTQNGSFDTISGVITTPDQPDILTLDGLLSIQKISLPSAIWPFVALLNQNLRTTASPTFNSLAITTNITSGTWHGSAITAPYISYNTTNLQNTAGALNTIQDISTTSSPTFNNLTINGLINGGTWSGGIINADYINFNTTNLQNFPLHQLNTIQNIHTGASPSFSGLTINGPMNLLGNITLATWHGVPITAPYINFNTTNLQNSSTVLNTIQDIATTSSPTFANLAITSTVTSGIWHGTAINAPYINFNTTNLQNSSNALNTIQDISTTSSVRFQQITCGIDFFLGGNLYTYQSWGGRTGGVYIDQSGNVNFNGGSNGNYYCVRDQNTDILFRIYNNNAGVNNAGKVMTKSNTLDDGNTGIATIVGMTNLNGGLTCTTSATFTSLAPVVNFNGSGTMFSHLTNNASNYGSVDIGRTGSEGQLCIAAGASQYCANSVAGDVVLRASNAGAWLHLGVGGVANSAIQVAPYQVKINASTVVFNYAGLTTASYFLLSIDSGGQLYKASSTRANKTNIVPYNPITTGVLNLQMYQYNYVDSGFQDWGVMAEDLDADPNLRSMVVYNNDGTPGGVKYDKIALYATAEVAKLVQVVKTQQTKITQMQTTITSQAATIAQMQTDIANIKIKLGL